MSDSFASFPQREHNFKPQPITIPVPNSHLHRRRKSSLAIMETRENKLEAANAAHNEKTAEANAISAAISAFNQKARRIEPKDIELPSHELAVDSFKKSGELDESVVISRLPDEGSLESHKGHKGNSDGTVQISSNFLIGSQKLNTTGGPVGVNNSNPSNYKSPSGGDSLSLADQADLEVLPESTLRDLLQETLKDRANLEHKVQKLDLKIKTLQKSILDRSRLQNSLLREEKTLQQAEEKTTVKGQVSSPTKPSRRTTLGKKLVQEVFAESPSLAHRSSSMWQNLDLLMHDVSTVKAQDSFKQPSGSHHKAGNSPFRVGGDKNVAGVKKRDMIIKSLRDSKPAFAKAFTRPAQSSALSEKIRPESGRLLPEKVRSFSINTTKRASCSKDAKAKHFKNSDSRTFKSFTLDESFILD